jgi:hypothetical protein
MAPPISRSAATNGRDWAGKGDAKEGKAPLTVDEEAQPDVRLAAVCVYDIVIELPAQYGGPERRKAQQAYSWTAARPDLAC